MGIEYLTFKKIVIIYTHFIYQNVYKLFPSLCLEIAFKS